MKPKVKSTYYKDDEALKLVGSRIREFRINKNISQETLANECDIDYSQVNRMELGKVNFSISYLYRIAKALKVNPKDLI
ncbi:MAG: helix-turn-helix domain-containing protein [Bacteroidota bacterium]|nr:helix-turn-helix domain-containing protein [Bacteroidota bacterium]